jgi:uncharacterized protein with von Willebrand factor type A (vWA) domain
VATHRVTVFVDKSGSMAEEFDRGVAKISVAAAMALAFHRVAGARVYLFDTEVEMVDPRRVVETLLRLGAAGGTDITQVLEEVARIRRRDMVYIVVTDGIDEVDERAIRCVERLGLASRIRFIIVPPGGGGGWLRRFWHRVVTDVPGFRRAVAEATRA